MPLPTATCTMNPRGHHGTFGSESQCTLSKPASTQEENNAQAKPIEMVQGGEPRGDAKSHIKIEDSYWTNGITL